MRVVGVVFAVILLAWPVEAQRGQTAPFRVAEEGTPLASRPLLNFVGTTITCAVDGSRITCTLTGGSGHTIQDEGSDLTARTNLNLTGAGVTCTDDAGNDQTDCEIPGGVTDATYWVGAAHAGLSAEINLGALSTALVLNTAGTPSAYAGIDCTNQFVRDVSGAGVGTCASVANADLAGSIAASKLIGTDIATVGTITSGTWSATGVASLSYNWQGGDSGGYNPTDNTNFYVPTNFSSPFIADPTTTAPTAATAFVPNVNRPCTITEAYITIVSATGSAETGAWGIRINNGTNTEIGSGIVFNATTSYSATGLSIALAAGDFFTLYFDPPTWATNPTGTFYAGRFLARCP